MAKALYIYKYIFLFEWWVFFITFLICTLMISCLGLLYHVKISLYLYTWQTSQFLAPYMMRSRERGGRYDDYDDYDYNRGRGGRDRRRSYSRSPRWRGRWVTEWFDLQFSLLFHCLCRQEISIKVKECFWSKGCKKVWLLDW